MKNKNSKEKNKAPTTLDNSNRTRRQVKNKVMILIAFTSFLLIITPLISILLQVFANGFKALTINAIRNEGGSPLTTTSGIKHALIGTIKVTILAVILGIPLGIITGMYLALYQENPFKNALRLAINAMVSIPTIITGVVVWALIVKTMGHFSILAGGIALAFIILPILAKSTEEMIRLVSPTYAEVGYSLGYTKTRTITTITLPIASRGIISSILLVTARITGETAPLLFTAFYSQTTPRTLQDPGATLPVLIYVYSISPFKHWQDLAWVAAMLLILINLTMLIVTRALLPRKISAE